MNDDTERPCTPEEIAEAMAIGAKNRQRKEAELAEYEDNMRVETEMMDRAIDLLAEVKLAEREAGAWTTKLPSMNTRAGVRRYVSAVTRGVADKQITGGEARILLYAAQLALSTIRGDHKAKRKPGRPPNQPNAKEAGDD